MRKLVVFAAIFATFSCKSSGDGGSDVQSADDIKTTFKDKATGKIRIVCDDGTEEEANSILEIDDNVVCGGKPVKTDSVSFYGSTNCTTGFMTQVAMVADPAQNEQRCASIGDSVTGQVQGVKLGNGACEEIRFTTFANACRLFTGVHGPKKSVTAFHANTQCTDMVASVRYSGNFAADKALCAKIGPLSGTQIQGVKRQDGKCEEVRFTSFTNACQLFSGGGPAPKKPVTAFHANTQCTDLIASLGYSFDLATTKDMCTAVGALNGDQVQAVQLADGACQEIFFTKLGAACLAFPNNAPMQGDRFVEFFTTSDCSVNLVAAINFGTDFNANKARCQAIGAVLGATVQGVKLDRGPCQTKNSTSFLNACLGFQ